MEPVSIRYDGCIKTLIWGGGPYFVSPILSIIFFLLRNLKKCAPLIYRQAQYILDSIVKQIYFFAYVVGKSGTSGIFRHSAYGWYFATAPMGLWAVFRNNA